MHKHVIQVSAAAALLLVTPARADVYHASSSIRGGAVTANWHVETECGFTGVDLWAFDRSVRVAGGETQEGQEIYIAAWEYDWCTGEAWDTQAWGTTGLSITRLEAASLDVALNIVSRRCALTDDAWLCGDDIVETGSLTAGFTGTGDTDAGRTSFTYEEGDTRVQQRSTGKYRAATATGSFMLRGVERLAGTVDAQLMQVTEGTHTVMRY
jgi:hypothetical protein